MMEKVDNVIEIFRGKENVYILRIYSIFLSLTVKGERSVGVVRLPHTTSSPYLDKSKILSLDFTL